MHIHINVTQFVEIAHWYKCDTIARKIHDWRVHIHKAYQFYTLLQLEKFFFKSSWFKDIDNNDSYYQNGLWNLKHSNLNWCHEGIIIIIIRIYGIFYA